MILIMTCSIVYIVDLSGFTDTWKEWLSKILTKGKITTSNYSFRPFSCSLCMTFWCGLIYLFVTNSFTIPMFGYVCLMSYLSDYIRQTILVMEHILNKIITYLSQL